MGVPIKEPTEKARLKRLKTCAVVMVGLRAATRARSTVVGVMNAETPTPAKSSQID